VRAEQLPEGFVATLVDELLGLSLEPAERGPGFRVTAVRRASGAEQIGLQVGDWLLAIGGRELSDTETLRRAVLALRGQARALVVVARGNGRYHVALPLI
jgi:S1-C subfamily serine protease